MKGTVIWFNQDMGYGFITPDPNEELKHDLLIQKQNIKTSNHSLYDGQRVEFEATKTEKGQEAINVHEAE